MQRFEVTFPAGRHSSASPVPKCRGLACALPPPIPTPPHLACSFGFAPHPTPTPPRPLHGIQQDMGMLKDALGRQQAQHGNERLHIPDVAAASWAVPRLLLTWQLALLVAGSAAGIRLANLPVAEAQTIEAGRHCRRCHPASGTHSLCPTAVRDPQSHAVCRSAGAGGRSGTPWWPRLQLRSRRARQARHKRG